MVLDHTLYREHGVLMKLRISPGSERTQNGEYKEGNEFFRIWTPASGSQFIFYNPRVVLLLQADGNKESRIVIPVSSIYSFKDLLQVSRVRLREEGLFVLSEGTLYCDKRIAEKNKLKLPLPRGYTIEALPAVVHSYLSDTEVPGIRLYSTRSSSDIQLPADTVNTIYEMLDRLDTNLYSIISSVAEKLMSMDKKLDKIMDDQNKILRLLNQQLMAPQQIPEYEEPYPNNYDVFD